MATTTRSTSRPWDDLPPSMPLLRACEIIRDTGLSKTTLYEMIAAKSFPPPIKIGTRAIAWPQAWINAFLAERAKNSAEIASPTKPESGRGNRRRLF